MMQKKKEINTKLQKLGKMLGLEDKNIRKICIWAVVLMIVGTFFVPIINGSVSDESIKQQVVEINMLNSIFTKNSLLRRFATGSKINSTIPPKQNNSTTPPIYVENVDVKGKLTRTYVFEYFEPLPSLIKLILQLLFIGPSGVGKVICIGYAEQKSPTYHHTVYPSEGWLLIGNETNLTGQLVGDISAINHDGKWWYIGIQGFTGTIIEINPEEIYFEGHAKEVGII